MLSGRTLAVAAAFVAGVLLSLWLRGMKYAPHEGSDGDNDLGRIERIVTMSPAVSEIVFALGGEHRVVGVSQYTTYPPATRRKPKCGGAFNPNFERIVALRPQLIITQGLAEEVDEFARRNGIRFLSVELTDLESVYAAIATIGDALGLPEQATDLGRRMRGRMDEISESVSDRPPVDTMLITGSEPETLRSINVVGPGSFLHDVLTRAGGRNIFADLSRRYAAVSKEAIAERAPRVIIELHGEGKLEPTTREQIKTTWAAMPGLPAVRNGRIHAVGETWAMIPGPRVVKLAERFAAILHPGRKD